MERGPERLGDVLRSWRDRRSPIDVGITPGHGRRARGLRREELAALAGLSVDYVVRLEQNRAPHPSAQVIAALARALQLTKTERDHLYLRAGLLPPADGSTSTHVPPGVQRVVQRFGENSPLAVFTAAWDLVTWNPLWAALNGDPAAIPPAQRNLARAVFGAGEAHRALNPSVSRNGDRAFEAAVVADLRAAAAAYPADEGLRSLIHELRTTSPGFERHWSRAEVGKHAGDRKTITHPAVGTITLDCDVLTAEGSDLRLIVYSAAPGSPDADKLDFLRVAQAAGAETTAGDAASLS